MALETACTSYSRVFYTGKLGNSIEGKLCESPGGDGTGMLENRLTLYSFRESLCKTFWENSMVKFFRVSISKTYEKTSSKFPS